MVKIFLDLLPKTWTGQRKKFLSLPLKSTIAVFWSYEDILLRHFYQVSKSGDYKTLIRSGEASAEECAEAWEKIVEQNNYQSGSNQLDNYKSLIMQLNQALKEQIAVVSTIKLCQIARILKKERNAEDLKFLKSKGYKVNTSTDESYVDSLAVALHESGRINTRIKIKLNQINVFHQRAMEQKEQGGESSLDDILTALSMEVGYQLPETITLSQYNAYAKRIKKRHEIAERAKRKNGHTA